FRESCLTRGRSFVPLSPLHFPSSSNDAPAPELYTLSLHDALPILIVLRPLRRAGDHFDAIANGDMTQRIDFSSRNEIGQLYAAMRRIQEGLSRVVSEVRAGVNEISAGSSHIYQGNQDLSVRTEQQAAALQQTAASMEELDSTVNQNTDNATEADRLSQGAVEVTERAGA